MAANAVIRPCIHVQEFGRLELCQVIAKLAVKFNSLAFHTSTLTVCAFSTCHALNPSLSTSGTRPQVVTIQTVYVVISIADATRSGKMT